MFGVKLRVLCILSVWSATAASLPPSSGPSSSKRFLSGKLAVHEPRDRRTDVQDLTLKIRVDPAKETIEGSAQYRGTLQRGVRELALEAVDLEIHQVTCKGNKAPCKWRYDQRRLRIEPHVSPQGHFDCQVTWVVRRPAMGIYFLGPDPDDPKRPVQVWTQGETHGARHWLPSPDNPDERLTWQVHITAPKSMTALSNGRRLATQVKGKLKETRYGITKAYPIYLLNVAVSDFVEEKHPHNRVKISSWVHRRHRKRARLKGLVTGKMMDFFERLLGVPYAHERYDHVYVDEFVAGGMENITLTTLTTRSVGDAGLDPDWDNEGLLAHELAHQWFGDLVTCRTWADLWLNEGFATYYQKLWTRQHHGKDRFAEQMASARQRAIGSNSALPRPIITDRYRHPSELFDGHTYIKGAWILHMLRTRLGPAVFDKGVREYLKNHAFQSVEVDDFRRALERASGVSLRGFFQRWLRQAGLPKVQAKISWRDGQLHVHAQQNQKIDGLRPAFDLEIPVVWDTGKGQKRASLKLNSKQAHLSVAMSAPPKWVMVDPEFSVLAQWKLKGDADLYLGAVRHCPYPDGRMRALEPVKGQLHRSKAVEILIERLRVEPARHVRARIAKLLGAANGDHVMRALQKSARTDPQSRVRRAAVEALGQMRRPQAFKTVLSVAKQDVSNLTRRAALSALVRLNRDKARPWLLRALRWKSWQDVIAAEALMQLAQGADVRDVKHIWKATKPGRSSTLRSAAVLALAAYGIRTAAAKEPIRQHLEGLLRETNRRLRSRTVSALESLGDPRSRGPLLAAADREVSFRTAARVRRVAKELGKKLPSEERIRRLEKQVRRLQRREKSTSHGHSHEGASKSNSKSSKSKSKKSHRGGAKGAK
ncbi:MAG TPA: hypothetical protein DCQ06_13500 [Myxococcales bacterium]|nr:hypothetical protein [Myxococcales bacterium]HAN32605.1 hypothetical protein [Myxococcales bacterium]